jgi:hypothetical protein
MGVNESVKIGFQGLAKMHVPTRCTAILSPNLMSQHQRETFEKFPVR